MSRESLVRRVAWVGAAGAAFGGVLAAGVAGLLAGSLVGRHAERILFADAIELASEIDEELDDEDDDEDDRNEPEPDERAALAAAMAHELEEDVDRPGASAAIFSSTGQRLVGDASLPLLAPGKCEAIDGVAHPRRVCAVELDDRTLVLGVSAQDERERLSLIALSLLAGGLIGATLGGLASWRSASWALAPLIELRDRVRQIDADAPSAAPLEPSSEHAEIEELRSAIASLVERLAVSLRHAQQFASQAAHELRTPLAVLAGELELLAETPELDHPTLDRLNHLHRRVNELTTLVQRLLMLAGSSKLAPEHAEAIDLADIIDVVREGLPSEHAERVRSSSEDDVIVRGDPELIRAMLANAVANALKFSTDVVDVHASGHDSEAWLEVIDRGPGIPAHEREHVFAPFFRSPGARADGTPGHGIGLALIRHVVNVHKGACEFVDVERGARLRIRLPRWR